MPETAAWNFTPFLGAALAAFVALTAWQWWWHKRDSRRPEGRRGNLPFIARAAAMLALLAAFLIPDRNVPHRITEEGRCFIGVDTSASMGICDEEGGQSRLHRALEILQVHGGVLAEISSRAKVERLMFDSIPRSASHLPDPDSAQTSGSGESTDLAALLEYLRTHAGRGRSCPALVFTDGRHNSPSIPGAEAECLQSAGVPLLMVGLGHPTPSRHGPDIAVTALVHPEKVFENEQLRVMVSVAETGGEYASGRLSVSLDGEKVFSKRLEFAPHRNFDLDFPLVAPAAGLHILEASLAPDNKDDKPENNVARGFLKVLRLKGVTWYLEGRPGWERKFLARVLERLPDIRVEFRDGFLETPENRLPTGSAWDDLRLLVLADVNPTELSEQSARDVAEYVGGGGALLLLAGPAHSRAEDWEQGPLAALCPVQWPRDGSREVKIARVEPAAGHENDELLPQRLGDKETFPWKEIPLAASVFPVRYTRPGATTLLYAYDSNGRAYPLLIEQPYGEGKVVLVASSSLWRWCFHAVPRPDIYEAFWGAVAMQLTRTKMSETNRLIFLDPPPKKVFDRQPAKVVVTVPEFTEAQVPGINAAGVTLEVLGPGGKTSVALGTGPGEYEETIPSEQSGVYRLAASLNLPEGSGSPLPVADSRAEPLITAEAAFERVLRSVELRDLSPNFPLLESLAAKSGGDFYNSMDAAAALARLRDLSRRTGKVVITRVSGRPPAWLWLFIAACLCIEWSLRKHNEALEKSTDAGG